jgi:hypothetical protein
LRPTLSVPIPSEHPLLQNQPTLAVIYPIAQDILLVFKEGSTPGTDGDTLSCLCIGPSLQSQPWKRDPCERFAPEACTGPLQPRYSWALGFPDLQELGCGVRCSPS